MESVLRDKQANLSKAAGYLDEAAAKGADLVCFPEMFFCGYSPSMTGSDYLAMAEEPEGETFRFLSAYARRHRMYVVAPIAAVCSAPGVIYNCALVIDRQGALMGTYCKTHLWAGEARTMRAGSEYPVFHMDFGTVGVMICYDGGFPEVSRILALNGAELILCPSAFPIQDKDMWDTYFGSRALENCCFTAALNCVGREEGCRMFGNNKVFNPRGHLLAEAPVDEEALLLCTFDLDEAAYHRQNGVYYLKDRRPDTYGALLRPDYPLGK
jgi:predicted amidohydrolase